MWMKKICKSSVAALAILVTWVLTASVPMVQQAPVLDAAYFYGGPGDQHAFGLVLEGASLYLSGYQLTRYGLITKVDSANGGLLWNAIQPEVMLAYSAAADSNNVFVAGNVRPPYCGAVDGYGGTESKPLFAVFNALTGAKTMCGSVLYFPNYRGYEGYYSIASAVEGTARVHYVAGDAEQWGWGGSRYVVAKYDSSGSRIGYAVDVLTFGGAWGVAVDSTGAYVAGYRRNGSHITFPELPFVVKVNSGLAEQWRSTIDAGASGARAFFRGITTAGPDVYAVGFWTEAGGNRNFLAAKLQAASGSIDWYRVFGGSGTDELYDVAVANGRLFVAGHTTSEGEGGFDAIMMELDPSNGDLLSSTTFGGTLDEQIYRMAAEGSDLWLAGSSYSFASPEGNSPGQADMLLLHYRTNRSPEANAGPDQMVDADAGCQSVVRLDGTGSGDPDDDPLSYLWTWPLGSASGPTPEIALPLGVHTVTLTVDDGYGGTSIDDVTITVRDKMPPSIQLLSVTPVVLWPPNHKMIPASIMASASDNCDSSVTARIISVTSNEPEMGTGDGDTAPDWEITGALTLLLRAERAGTGDGRIYTILLRATDSSGNLAEKTAQVLVPKNQGGK